MRLASLVILALTLTACRISSMADVKPGWGKAATFTGKSYEQVWAAAVKVAAEHFEIRELSFATGVIQAERPTTKWGATGATGAWIGVYITPPGPGAPSYRVEVVSRKKAVGLGEQGWEGKTLRDIQDVLEGRPMR